jgi:hypothetical protein
MHAFHIYEQGLRDLRLTSLGYGGGAAWILRDNSQGREWLSEAKATCPAFKIHIILILLLPQKVHTLRGACSLVCNGTALNATSSRAQRFPAVLSSGRSTRSQIRKERIGVGRLFWIKIMVQVERHAELSYSWMNCKLQTSNFLCDLNLSARRLYSWSIFYAMRVISLWVYDEKKKLKMSKRKTKN